MAATVVGGARFASNWLVAWKYGPADHGQFTIVFQLFSTLVIVGELGMVTTFGVRQISLAVPRGESTLNQLINRLSGTHLLIHTGIAVLLVIFATPLALWINVDDAYIRLVAAWIWGIAIYRLTMMLANGLERSVYFTATTLIFHSGWILWLTVCLLTHRSLGYLYVGWAIAFPSAAVVSWAVMPPLLRRHHLRLRPCISSLKHTLATLWSALPYSLPMTGMLILPGIMCVVLAPLWQSRSEISFFQITFTLCVLPNLVAIPMSNAMLPTLTRLTTASSGQANITTAEPNRLVKQGFGLLAAFATLAFACFWPLGSWLLGLIRDVYRDQHAVLLLLSAGISFEVCRLLVDQLLMASRHVRVVAWSEIARYIVLIVVALWGIALWGAIGAAVAVTSSMLVNFVIKIIAARRLMGLRLYTEAIALAGLILAIAAVGSLQRYPWLTLPVWLTGVLALRFVQPNQLWRWRPFAQG